MQRRRHRLVTPGRRLQHAVNGDDLGKVCRPGGKFLSKKLDFGLLHSFVAAFVAFAVVELDHAVQITHAFEREDRSIGKFDRFSIGRCSSRIESVQ